MKFCITFGQRHPLRDNWIEVEAVNESAARQEILDLFGTKWGFLYKETEFNPSYFTGGKVGRTLICLE